MLGFRLHKHYCYLFGIEMVMQMMRKLFKKALNGGLFVIYRRVEIFWQASNLYNALTINNFIRF